MTPNRTTHKISKKSANLVRAAKQSLDELFRPGTSKKMAREEYNQQIRNEARKNGKSEDEIRTMKYFSSPYIHGYNTYYQYLYLVEKYAIWLADTHPDVQKLKYALRKGYAQEYIQQMIDAGYAASTIARTTSALAKLYRCSAEDIHDDRPLRKYSDFTRSRGYSEAQYLVDVEKYGTIPELCRIAGPRECELKHIYRRCFCEGPDGKLYLHLDGKEQHTKGGKTRDVVILDEHQQRLREILADYEDDDLICPNPPSHLDIHAIRALYAMDYYAHIARDIADIPADERLSLKHPKIDNSRPNQKRTTSPGTYTRRADGRKFDRTALLIVSESLGHSREDVVVHSYLR